MPWTDELKKEDDCHIQSTVLKGQYDALAASLSPMIKDTLVELGKALWGKRSFTHNFRFRSYKEAGHQAWMIERGLLPLQNPDRVSVMLSKDMKKFYICCKDKEDYRNCSVKDCHGLSKHALTESLLNTCKERNWHLQN